MEEAAIRGHPEARSNVGCEEWEVNGNAERAVKYWIIAAPQGFDLVTKALIQMIKMGLICKEDLAATLRAHQAATKSPKREMADKFFAADDGK